MKKYQEFMDGIITDFELINAWNELGIGSGRKDLLGIPSEAVTHFNRHGTFDLTVLCFRIGKDNYKHINCYAMNDDKSMVNLSLHGLKFGFCEVLSFDETHIKLKLNEVLGDEYTRLMNCGTLPKVYLGNGAYQQYQ